MTLYLTRVNAEKRALAIRAVKRCLEAAGQPAEQAMINADDAVHRWLNTQQPQGIIGPGVDGAATARALAAFNDAVGDTGAAELTADLPQQTEGVGAMASEPVMPTPGKAALFARAREGLASDFIASRPAYRTAILIMALVNGHAATAWHTAVQFGDVTEDPDFWVEVANTIEDTFGREPG